MFKVVLTVACLVLSAAPLRAGGLDDLKSANAAAEQGNVNDALRLFTQAIAAGDLSPADQFTARKNRGHGYVARSMIDDAFMRLDQARTARADAIADYTAAIALKPDDAKVFIGRGQAHHLNGEYDLAIADFDAAQKLDATVLTGVQRAASLRAKGDYEGAVAGYSAALTADLKDSGLDAWDVYNERGTTYFLAERFDTAAADFEKALTAGSASHNGDVLWLPYQVAWLHLARARAGQDDAAELARNAANIDVKQWPGTLVAYFLGQVTPDQLSPPSSHGQMGHGRECNLSFFVAEQALIKRDSAEAGRQFQRALGVCNIHTTIYLAAGAELKRLKK